MFNMGPVEMMVIGSALGLEASVFSPASAP